MIENTIDPQPHPGIYLVTLNNEEPISVNAHDPRIADRCITVRRGHCKVGRARNLLARRGNYLRTFGPTNVNFTVLAQTQDIARIEKAVLERLRAYRIRGRANRPTEWLDGISAKGAADIVNEVVAELILAPD